MRNFYIEAAKCKVFAVLEDTCRKEKAWNDLEYMGFTVDVGSGLPAGINLSHDLVKDDNYKACKAMWIWLSSARHRAGSMMWHYSSWMGLLALGASDIHDDVEECIILLRRHYRAYLNAMAFGKKSAFLQEGVAASPFFSVIVREFA